MAVLVGSHQNGWPSIAELGQMETVRVGGHKYSDPDVISLIHATGEFVDPRSAVLTQARRAAADYKTLGGDFSDPLQRVIIMASMLGIKTIPMSLEQRGAEGRDAVLVNTESGKLILYNPDRPKQRVAFSIAHEITHTFFPNSIKGSRFRNICAEESREANELERLCDLGAAEILMPIEDFQEVLSGEYSLTAVDRLSQFFGSSKEATIYRLATAHPGKAVAGLLKYRLSLPEQRLRDKNLMQRGLFCPAKIADAQEHQPKYRRQSLYLSHQSNDSYTIRWNKSFVKTSCVYQSNTCEIMIGAEELPNNSGKIGRLEAMLAPYQRRDAHQNFGDVLFFWEEM
jgi:Zn-dependent peptidase ImmA (M78 family)